MTLGNTTTYIDALVDAGADALSNLYYIQFLSNGNSGYVDGTMSTALTVRSTQVSLPTATHSDKERHFLTTSASFPVAEIQMDKQFSITFRIDSHYDVYRYLLRQQAVTTIPNLAYAASELSEEKNAIITNGDQNNRGFTVRFYSMQRGVSNTIYETPVMTGDGFIPSQYGYKMLYEFSYCWIEKLTPLEFGWDKADAQTVQASINFMKYLDPQNLLLTKNALGITTQA